MVAFVCLRFNGYSLIHIHDENKVDNELTMLFMLKAGRLGEMAGNLDGH